MNLDPNNPTPAPGRSEQAIDESLLNEALAEPTPAELEAKIIELTDPAMLSLLDEALAPEPASDALTQRILAATAGQVHAAQAPAVVARIGPSTFRYAAAAVILLAVGLGVWFTNQPEDSSDPTLAGVNDTPTTAPDDADDPSGADWLDSEQFASSDSFFEDTTELIEGTLEIASDSLNDVTISRDTIWSELDAYEQFLTDIEAGDV